MLCSIYYDESGSSSYEEGASSEGEMSTPNRDSTLEVEKFHSSVGDIVVVYNELIKFLRYFGLVQEIENENISGQNLKRSDRTETKTSSHQTK